jgi:hypothetical protein
MTGTLIVVGSGIQSVGHITLEAQGWIKSADKVLYAVVDPVTAAYIKMIAKPGSEPEDLKDYYPDHLTNPYPEQITDTVVANIANRIVYWVNQGLNVCAVFYGHPGMLVDPAHKVMVWARNQSLGHDQSLGRMLPGISALDCLFADLNVNPGDTGFQMFEAWDFLSRVARPARRAARPGRPATLDPYCHVVFWEIGLMWQVEPGEPTYTLEDLYKQLRTYYDDAQPIVHYQRPQLPMFTYMQPSASLTLHDLPDLETNSASTLYIAPKGDTAAPTVFKDKDADWEPGRVVQVPRTHAGLSPALTLIRDRLFDLAQDPQHLNAFLLDRQVLVDGSGLSDEDAATLTGNDMQAIIAKLKDLVPPTQVQNLTGGHLRDALAQGQQPSVSLAQAITVWETTTSANAFGMW